MLRTGRVIALSVVVLATAIAIPQSAVADLWSNRVAYVVGENSDDVRVLDLATGQSTQVPNLPSTGGYWWPQWSRDGAWLTMWSGSGQIVKVRPDGSGFLQLTPEPYGSNVVPSFSPDGSQLVFHQVYGEMYTINSDGTNPTPRGVWLGHTRWSPVDNRIASTNWATPTYESDIFIHDLDTGTTTQITQHSPNHYFNYADWSPDGTKLAVAGGELYGNQDIFVMNSDGTGLVNRTGGWSGWNDEGYASYTPDGDFIVFSSTYGSPLGNHDIWAVPADGVGGPINLTNTPDINEVSPAVIPEPGTLALLPVAGLGLLTRRRRG